MITHLKGRAATTWKYQCTFMHGHIATFISQNMVAATYSCSDDFNLQDLVLTTFVVDDCYSSSGPWPSSKCPNLKCCMSLSI